MEQNRFFLWLARTNSILFLVLLILCIGLVTFGVLEGNRWGKKNTVEIVDKNETEDVKSLRLSDITKICGQDVQYVKLNSPRSSKGFSSGGYGTNIRNIVFFAGKEMASHWLFETDNYVIANVSQLSTKSNNCKKRETVAIYYEVIKEDTDGNGRLEDGDLVAVSLTAPDGSKYREIETDITSILDHSIDDNASVLTILLQSKRNILMKKYSLASNQLISEREITRIGKRL